MPSIVARNNLDPLIHCIFIPCRPEILFDNSSFLSNEVGFEFNCLYFELTIFFKHTEIIDSIIQEDD